jgi:hypothetical protein
LLLAKKIEMWAWLQDVKFSAFGKNAEGENPLLLGSETDCHYLNHSLSGTASRSGQLIVPV